MGDDIAFYLGNVAVRGRLVLAPMSGYNDQPFRRLCRSCGASVVYTGLLASNSILYGPRPLGTQRTEEMLRFHPEEGPLVAQLVGNDVESLVAAARKIEPLGMEMIDVNLGCAAPKIVRSGAGSALLRDPATVGRIFAALSAALTVPISGKIRLGWDDASRNYLEIVRAMEDNGAVLIAVHGRTAEQAYRGRADWEAIAEVKATAGIPVLASGDVKAPADIDRMLALTGCDGVMIGRAAVGNPWIFERRTRDEVAWPERYPVIQRHLSMSVDFHGPHHGVQRFRKHLRGYLRSSGISRKDRMRMIQCDDVDMLHDLLQRTLNDHAIYDNVPDLVEEIDDGV